MNNISLTLSYCGTNYHGWQRQKNSLTVQEVLEKAIATQTGQHSYVSGCGRTDSGVHARVYRANFKSDTVIPIDRLAHALNAILPRDIVISKAEIVDNSFDSRFSCVAKEYTYVFYNSPLPCPFENQRSFYLLKPLNVLAMEEAAAHFVGKQDFAAVRNLGTPVTTTVRNIYYCRVTQKGKYVYLTVCADGFLYNMVRNIAGCLWYVGFDKYTPQDIRTLLDRGDRSESGPTVPPHGLYMTGVFYTEQELQNGIQST